MYNDPVMISASLFEHTYRAPIFFNRMWAGDFHGDVAKISENAQMMR